MSWQPASAPASSCCKQASNEVNPIDDSSRAPDQCALCVCAAGLLLREGAVLLGRRSTHKTHPSTWDLPGGHVEHGESPEAALVRELSEELGIEVLRWGHHSTHESPSMVLHVFMVTEWVGTPCRNNDEHSEVRWHHLRSACNLSLADPRLGDLLGSLSGTDAAASKAERA